MLRVLRRTVLTARTEQLTLSAGNTAGLLRSTGLRLAGANRLKTIRRTGKARVELRVNVVLILQSTRTGILYSGNICISQLATLMVTRRLLTATLGRTTLIPTVLSRFLRGILSGLLLHAVERVCQLLQGETALLTDPVALGDLRDLVFTLSDLRVSLLAGSLGNTLNLLLKRKLSGLRAA